MVLAIGPLREHRYGMTGTINSSSNGTAFRKPPTRPDERSQHHYTSSQTQAQSTTNPPSSKYSHADYESCATCTHQINHNLPRVEHQYVPYKAGHTTDTGTDIGSSWQSPAGGVGWGREDQHTAQDLHIPSNYNRGSDLNTQSTQPLPSYTSNTDIDTDPNLPIPYPEHDFDPLSSSQPYSNSTGWPNHHNTQFGLPDKLRHLTTFSGIPPKGYIMTYSGRGNPLKFQDYFAARVDISVRLNPNHPSIINTTRTSSEKSDYKYSYDLGNPLVQNAYEGYILQNRNSEFEFVWVNYDNQSEWSKDKKSLGPLKLSESLKRQACTRANMIMNNGKGSFRGGGRRIGGYLDLDVHNDYRESLGLRPRPA
ncbi:uncharacterized protein L199_005511 [Kwoniella botswanensis]|uniref:uncharacterized protein n=1 Tax=Kwoniella botswanensis TaxID=1268659 RepID=UPI00315CA4CB